MHCWMQQITKTHVAKMFRPLVIRLGSGGVKEGTMNEGKIGRRTFIRGASLAALSTAGLLDTSISQAQVAVPNSAGTELPKLKAPALACDCHHHIYDPARFAPLQPGAVPNARVAEYRLLQRRIGTTRNVVVTPRPYATDNRVTLDPAFLSEETNCDHRP